MPAMASLSKLSLPRKKLERRNGMRISDYTATDLPGSPAFPSSFRTLDKGNSKSFRVLGVDTQGEIERICEELGLPGGADAFSIPQDAWEAGRARSGSLDRFMVDHHKAGSRSLEGSFFDQRAAGGRGGELASSPSASAYVLSPSPYYNSMTSSSGDSFASDTSLVAGEKAFFDSLDSPREHVLPHLGTLETHSHDDHQQIANAFQRDRKQTGNVAREMRHQDDRQTHTTFYPGHESGIHLTRHEGIHVTRHEDDLQTVSDMKRVSRAVVQATETKRQTLLPPPAIGVKSYLPSLSTQELLAGFGPDEHINEDNHQISDQDDASQSDSEGYQADVIEDQSGEEFGFVSEVVQQHGVPAKERTLEQDAGAMTPSTPEHNVENISIQSWRKLDLLGSGSFGTVYEGMSEDGVYFAVKEVSLSENDSKAQQCVTQLEQEIEFLSRFKHENIVRYLGTQKEPDKLYIFLELVTKGSLSSLYQKYTLFDSQIRSYTRQILSGLKYLHERKIMHRDIKCANILVDVNGKIKVADFGLAKQISQLDELKSCKGSAYWMAPEVIDPRKTYSFPADIWSLGCTVLEMATRRPPFGDMEWHRALWKVGHGEAPPIPETLTEEAKDFIKHCLEVNPARRPSASQLLEHPFVQYVGGTGLTPRNSFTLDTSELPIIAEEKTFDG